MKKVKLILLFLTLFLFNPKSSLAGDTTKVVTIVNPVRISRYNQNPEESVRSEYEIIKEFGLPATWLFTYDVLEDQKVIGEINKMDENQEFGVFLEITRNFAENVGVEYNETGSWHHANSVFLSGYTQEERKIFIDNIFEKYKSIFGNYPKSVGSWWTDGYSLSYMREKYGIVANLVCADQFSTDNYQIWGQPWQMAYYPSKFHPAVPADSKENKLNVVNIQWATRDPLNGYQSSLYSTQDYLLTDKNLNTTYFEKLIKTYLNSENNLNQVVVGLEGDLSPKGYSKEYRNQIEVVNNLKDEGVEVMTMSEFYNLFSKNYPEGNSEVKYDTEESYWYTSSYYRLFYVKDLGSRKIEIKDFRVYDEQMLDPYFFSPNGEINLSINIPFIIDTIQNPENSWVLPEGTHIKTEKDKVTITGKKLKVPRFVKNNPLLKVKQSRNEIDISFINLKFETSQGNIEKGLSLEAKHFFKTKSFIFKLLTGKHWDYFKKVEYLIPKEEIYALLYLKSLPKGKVMVADRECLQCSWSTDKRPIFFANTRKYVKKYSGKSIVYNISVLDAKTIEEAKKEFNKLGVGYVYLLSFEGYREKLPFSPGDLGVKLVYKNANSEIWKVEK